MEPRRLRSSPGGPDGAQEVQIEPKRPRPSPGGPEREAKRWESAKSVELSSQSGWLDALGRYLGIHRLLKVCNCRQIWAVN
jgi:hypothetical protein